MKKYFISALLLSACFSFASSQVVGDVPPPDSVGQSCTDLKYNLTYKKSRDSKINGEVSDLQFFLQDQGLLKVDPTGYFGSLTFSAVKIFQSKNGLVAYGYVGPATRAVIKNMTCNSTSSIVSTIVPSADNTSLTGVFVIQDDGILVNSNNIVDEKAVARKFYALNPNQKNNYDFLSIFTTFHDPSQVENHQTINNVVTGTNESIVLSNSDDIPNKLLGINFLNDTYSASSGNVTPENVNNNLFLMDHEVGHQWLTYIGVPQNISDGIHYTKWIDTGFIKNGQQWGDSMGGWPWKDNGDGTVSVNNIEKTGFSKLSLYLMGLAPISEVSDIKIVVPLNSQDEKFQNVKGVFKTITVNDITKLYGVRSPSYQNSQKDFKMAYILLIKKGETSLQYKANLEIVSAIARDFPKEWSLITEGRSTISQAPSTSNISDSSTSSGLPTLSLTTDSSAPGFGQSVTLSWYSTNASSCTASSSVYDSLWIDKVSTSGKKLVEPINQKIVYTLVCSSKNGDSISKSLAFSPRG